MATEARSKLLQKISINGFAIEEKGNQLTLMPRGTEATAKITIQEVKPGTWKVVSAFGQYASFARGKKKAMFESYVNRWALEAELQAVP
jgi:hypothetical protein